jgi:hypothetical protein
MSAISGCFWNSELGSSNNDVVIREGRFVSGGVISVHQRNQRLLLELGTWNSELV